MNSKYVRLYVFREELLVRKDADTLAMFLCTNRGLLMCKLPVRKLSLPSHTSLTHVLALRPCVPCVRAF